MAALGAFGAAKLRADGIALSQDGMTWQTGTGAYGAGWGEVGKCINVTAGGTFYLKYHSDSDTNVALYYAPHGSKWGSWTRTGPELPGIIGTSSNPIILKFQDVGTDKSTITWVNGSGRWRGIISAGNYDLALRSDAAWTLPPVSITAAPPSRSWWRLFNPLPASASENGSPSVPDNGGTILLLGFGFASLGLLWWVLNHRRARARSANHPPEEGAARRG